MSTFLAWVGLSVMLGGLVIECAALIGTKYYSLARWLPFTAVGFIVFYVGALVLVIAKVFR